MGPVGHREGPSRPRARRRAERAGRVRAASRHRRVPRRQPIGARTDWGRIVLLYAALRHVAPSPVVDLNHAVAVSMASGAAPALDLVDRIVADGALTEFHYLHVVRGELLARLGRRAEARSQFLKAATVCTNNAERAVLEAKATAAASEAHRSNG